MQSLSPFLLPGFGLGLNYIPQKKTVHTYNLHGHSIQIISPGSDWGGLFPSAFDLNP